MRCAPQKRDWVQNMPYMLQPVVFILTDTT